MDECTLSELLCTTLDSSGFSAAQIEWRKHAMQRLIDNEQSKLNATLQEVTKVDTILAGSKAEGIGIHFVSDTDILNVLRQVICVEGEAVDEGLTTFKMETALAAPGYIHMKLGSIGSSGLFNLALLAWLSPKNAYSNDLYFSSSSFNKGFQIGGRIAAIQTDHMRVNACRTGPACTVDTEWKHSDGKRMFGMVNHSSDNVGAIPVHPASILRRWADRPRFHDWPSRAVIDEGRDMEVYAVPVGSKEGLYRDFEWRLCCTHTEQLLTSSLSDVRMKLYVLLKVIKTDILGNMCKVKVTSYMMKNVVYWISEGACERMFTPRSLLGICIKALRFLRQCVKNFNLPYYMIPERNLLDGKIKHQDCAHLASCLGELIEEGPCFILRAGKLATRMYFIDSRPSIAPLLKDYRNHLEHHLVEAVTNATKPLYDVIMEKIITGSEVNFLQDIMLNVLPNTDLQTMTYRYDLVFPGWKEYITTTGDITGLEEYVNTRIVDILSL